MHALKTIVDAIGPHLIEKMGYLLNPLILNLKKEKNQLLVFTFHGLFDSIKQKQLNHIDPQNNMRVEQFILFLNYFQDRNYKFISPEDLKEGLKRDCTYAMLTFDDGYFNNTLAFDILEKYKIPAVLFVTTKNITENNRFGGISFINIELGKVIILKLYVLNKNF